MNVVCPACNECIGMVNGGSFANDMLLADALGVYHQHLCRASREDYYNTTITASATCSDQGVIASPLGSFSSKLNWEPQRHSNPPA